MMIRGRGRQDILAAEQHAVEACSKLDADLSIFCFANLNAQKLANLLTWGASRFFNLSDFSIEPEHFMILYITLSMMLQFCMLDSSELPLL